MGVDPHCEARQILLPHRQGVILHVGGKTGINLSHFFGIRNRGKLPADKDNRFEIFGAHHSPNPMTLCLVRPTTDNARIAHKLFASGTNCCYVCCTIVLFGDCVVGFTNCFAPERGGINNPHRTVFDNETDGVRSLTVNDDCVVTGFFERNSP